MFSKVPLVPQWNQIHGCVCTPDGGFLYLGARSVNYIGKMVEGKVPLQREFHTRQSVDSVDIDPAWAPQGTAGLRRFAVLAQDSSVQIWDFDTGCAVSAHKAHFNLARYMERGPQSNSREHIVMSYTSNGNVLSMSAHDLVVYCVASNSFSRRSSFLPGARNQVWTVLRCSPTQANLFAVGSCRGAVLLCDLQKLKVLYTMRGHDAAITSLAWTSVAAEAPVASTTTANAPTTPLPSKPDAGNDDIFDIYDYDYLENEFGAPAKLAADKAAMTEFVGTEKPLEAAASSQFDFVEACQNLKQDMNALKDESPPAYGDDAVTLADCQRVERTDNASVSCSSNGSNDEANECSSHSDADSSECKAKPQQQIVFHQAEVHATQTLERSPDAIDARVKRPPGAAAPATDNVVLLLASASVDGKFCIWNAQTGANCDTLSSAGTHGKNTQIEVAWCDATTLITNNRLGDLQLWTLKPPDAAAAASIGNRSSYKFIEEKRRFSQSAIAAFSAADQCLWTISWNREIMCENLLTRKQMAKYCCASTNICVMRECPDDMNKIALGFSDRRIGILDISKHSPSTVHIENFTQRIDSQVLSLIWSPDNKRLAFGTSEGRVGIINVENSKQAPLTFNSICGKRIYSVEWQANNIFVVCNDQVAVYDAEAKIKDAFVVQEVKNATALSVRADFLFVGTKSGNLQIYRRQEASSAAAAAHHWTVALLHDISVASHYITEISWSPIASDHFAVAANDNNIAVLCFDFTSAALLEKRRIKIRNPKAANGCIKWSNRSAHLLLSAGFDGAMRVWDLTSEAPDEEKYLRQFHCPMSCGLFLPTDEAYFLCAGKATSVELVDMRVVPSVIDASGPRKRSTTAASALDNIKWASKTLLRHESNSTEKRRNRRKLAGTVEASADVDNDDDDADADSQEVKGLEAAATLKAKAANRQEIAALMDKLKIIESERNTTNGKCSEHCGAAYMKQPNTLLYLTTKELNKSALDLLMAHLASKKTRKCSSEQSISGKLFGTRREALELLQEELANYQHSETKGISSLLMPQLMGDGFKKEIMQCIEKRTLNAWHVAMAPTISYCFWKICCQAYADQLLEQNCALQAASYLLALHKHSDAIDVLTQRQYFKEALLLARIYLQSADPQLASIENQWIAHLDHTGNLSAAAFLCVLTGQVNRAAETLAKWRSPPAEVQHVLELLKTKKAR